MRQKDRSPNVGEHLPREKMMRFGAAHLRDLELVSILLGSGSGQRKLKKLAAAVLKKLDQHCTEVDLRVLMEIDGIGLAKATLIVAALEFSRRRFQPLQRRISSAEDVFRCVSHLADRQENFIALTLNGAGELLHTRIITRGLVNQTLVHPREVFADAIVDRAALIIMAHNHPSGDLTPSQEDLTSTKAIAQAGELLGIELYDHVIFNQVSFFSLQENGYL